MSVFPARCWKRRLKPRCAVTLLSRLKLKWARLLRPRKDPLCLKTKPPYSASGTAQIWVVNESDNLVNTSVSQLRSLTHSPVFEFRIFLCAWHLLNWYICYNKTTHTLKVFKEMIRAVISNGSDQEKEIGFKATESDAAAWFSSGVTLVLVILSAQLGVQESRPGPENHRADPQGGEDWRAGRAEKSAPAAALQGQQETARSGLQSKSSLRLRVTSAQLQWLRKPASIQTDFLSL